MYTIGMYVLNPYITSILIPEGSEILGIVTTQIEAELCIKVKRKGIMKERFFKSFHVAQDLPDNAKYIGSYSLDHGYVFNHLFEIQKEDA